MMSSIRKLVTVAVAVFVSAAGLWAQDSGAHSGLSASEQQQVAVAAHQRNLNACLYGLYGCQTGDLSTSEQQQVAVAAHQRNLNACLYGLYGCKAGDLSASELQALPNHSSPTVLVPAGCAENGSCYGDISEKTGRPKTVPVRGYFRKDGTYVRGYYRSSPRR